MQPSLAQIFWAFLVLGATAFGGPVAHFGYFRTEFVERRKWIDERGFADLVSLCQFLPGPASSQTGIAIGMIKGRWAGGIAAWLGFTTPAAIIMIGLGFGLSFAETSAGQGLVHGLKLAAVAVVAHALWGMARTACGDAVRASFAAVACILILFAGDAWFQLAVIALAAFAGSLILKDTPLDPANGTPTRGNRTAGFALLAVFLLMLFALPVVAESARSGNLDAFTSFFRVGSLVFGGGHVVLPLLEAEVVPTGWASTDAFLAGYGAAQAIPGPMFALTGYLGNVIDPLHVIEGISLKDLNETLTGGNLDEKEVKKAQQGQAQDYPEGIPECGTDAMRFALVAYTAQGRDINLDVLRVVGYRHWCNKLWNAIRFAIMNLGDDYKPPEEPLTVNTPGLSPASKWALHRLNSAVKTTVDAMEVYDFSNATTGVYAFWQYDVCDVFIELMKPVMNGADEAAKKATRDTLWTCLDGGLRLLHPFMPFVTEELWQRLPRRAAETAPSIMVADYPAFTDARVDAAVEESMAVAQEIVKATRSLRAAYNLQPKAKAELFVKTRGDVATDAAKQFAEGIATLAGCARVDVIGPDDEVPPGCGVTIINESISVYLMLKGVVDPAAEIAKLEKKSSQTKKSIAALQKQMEMPGYEEKVPENVRADNAEKLSKLEAEVASTAAAMEDFKKLI